LSSEKLARETGFVPAMSFETGLAQTVQWYRENHVWTERVRSGAYRAYYEMNYGRRGGAAPLPATGQSAI
jgi:dTDP-glucose 4,6-dehydratase